MRVITKNSGNKNEECDALETSLNRRGSSKAAVSLSSELVGSYVEYREMDLNPVQSVDPLLKLSKNLGQLSELTSRLSFMNREVAYLLKV